MKHMIKLPAILLGLLLLLTGATQKVMAQDEDISLQSFYDELSPYGTWIQDPQYGYVWRPDADQSDFRPYYTNGRWAMTEYGNTWVSDYDWGWAPFHYGRWVYNRYSQWVWIPDTVWGPAWVSWRSGGGYYGWAPMGPGMNINVNINIPSLWWVFVPQRNIYYGGYPRYYSRRNNVYINNTVVINNVYSRNRHSYYTGPRAEDIRRDTRQNVRVYSIDRSSRPGRSGVNGDRINIYTPSRSSRESIANAAPRNAVRGEGYTSPRSSERPERREVSDGRDGGRNDGVRNEVPRSRTDAGNVRGNESVRPERSAQDRVQQPRQADRQVQPRQEQVRQERQPRQMQSTEEQPTRVEPRQEQPRQVQPRQEQPRQEQQRQEQPRQVQPQQERRVAPQRVEQGSSRSSESRGSQGQTRAARSSRGGRG